MKESKRPHGHPKERKEPPLSGVTAMGQDTLQQAISLHRAGRLPEAEALYRKILSTTPKHPVALNLLGRLAYQAGKSEIAVELISKAIEYKNDYVDAYSNLGVIFNLIGQHDKAVANLKKALALKPDYAEVHSNLGNALRDQGKLEEAAASFRSALRLKPNHAQIHFNLGNALKDLGNMDEAIACFTQSVVLQPDYTDALNNLGNIFRDLGKLDEAITCFRKVIKLRPDIAGVHNNLGNTLREKGELKEAVACFKQSLTLQPNFAEALNNLGNTSFELGKLDEAIACFRKALEVKPDYTEALNNMGNVFRVQGYLDDAADCYRRVLTLKPDLAATHSNLLMCMNNYPDITQREIYERSLEWDMQHAKALLNEKKVYPNSRTTERRLKVGYLSPDFRNHSVAYFIEPILKTHNRKNVEVFCYANVKRPDQRTKQIQEATDHWRPIFGISDIKVVEHISNDKIDILVDLAGHTADNRLLVFARKPAPLQVNWLGYPNTSGMSAIDYRFTDAIADPLGEADRLHSEKLVRLKHGFLCYEPDAHTPDVVSPPCMDSGYLTFGSFNNLAKLNASVINTWAEILRRMPFSRLLLKSKPLADSETKKRYIRMFEENGITEDRLELHGWLPANQDHLELYSKVDIGLDPFPYNGTTTTCEALWMGVPVITMPGNRHAARVGVSIMHHAGLNELVADSKEYYIALALSLANDQSRLRTIRQGLRQKLRKSELMNKRLHTEVLEKEYRLMWRKWCSEN